MTDVDASQGSQQEVPPPPAKRRNPLRRPLIVVLLVALAFFTYSLIADRVTPYTAQATIQASVVRIAPEVSGPIVSVAVRDNDRVPAGQELFTIDPLNYEIAVEAADADLAAAGQAIGGSTAGVSAAQARLATTCVYVGPSRTSSADASPRTRAAIMSGS